MPKAKAPKLDATTLDVVKRVLALPPKQNKDLKVGDRSQRSASLKPAPLPPSLVPLNELIAIGDFRQLAGTLDACHRYPWQ